MRSRRDYLGAIPYSANSIVDLPNGIPNTFPLVGLLLRLSGTLNKTASAAGTLATETPLPLIRQIEISHPMIPGGGLVRRVDGGQAFHFGRLMQGFAVERDAIAAATSGNEAFTASIFVPFVLSRTQNPRMTLFNPRGLGSNPRLQITWGSEESLCAGGTYSVKTVVNCQIAVYAIRIDDPEFFGLSFGIHKHSVMEYSRNATAITSDTFPLPRDHYLRGLWIRTFTASPDTNIGTLLNNFRIQVNKSDVRWQRNAPELLAECNATFGVALPTGHYFLDLLQDGDIADLVMSRNFTDLDLVTDTASVANAIVRIYPIQVVPRV